MDAEKSKRPHTDDPPPERYVDFDEFSDVVASLNTLSWTVSNLKEAPYFWKSAILSAHSAVQGACVCILTQTDGTGALTRECEQETKDRLYGVTGGSRHLDDPGKKRPEPHLANLETLVKRLPASLGIHMTRRSAKSWPYNRDGDLRRLNEFRNQFSHFHSTSWMIEVEGLPRIILHALDVVEAIATSPHYDRWNKFSELDWKSPMERARETFRSL